MPRKAAADAVSKPPANRGALRAKRRNMSIPERQHQIVVAGAALFAESGYASVSMDDISDRVGVSKPTLYYYFDGKQDILAAVFREVQEHVHSRFDERASLGATPFEQIEGAIHDLLIMHELLPGYQRVFLHHLPDLDDEMREWVIASRSDYQRKVRSLVEAAVEAGDVDPTVDVRLVSQVIFGMGSYSYQWWDSSTDDAREASKIFTDALIYGIQRSPGDS